MALVDLVERVRSALSVSADYDAQIEAGIKSAGRRLLRDYNFPKQIVKLTYPLVAAGSQYLALPADFKKPLGVRLSQFEEATTFWSEPLTRAEAFKLPSPDGVPRHYWVEGTNLWLDTAMPQDGLDVVLWYQSASWDDNAAWLLADQEDTLFYFAMTRLAPEMRKKEVFEVFAPLWSDERQSLAIYLNELEWDDVTILMREPQAYVTSREMLSGLGTPSIFSLYGRAFVQVEDAAGARALLELGQAATFDILPIANGGTGASDAAQARLNLALRPGVEVQAYDADLAAIAAVSTTAYGRGFLGLADNAAARSYLSLGTLAIQNANSVSIIGGTISGVTLSSAAATITGGTITGITDLAVADGGTGASTAAAARTNLGLVIGTDVQAQDADLQAIAALSTTAFGRGFLDLADNAAARAKLSLGTAAVYNVGTSGNTVPLLDGANTWSTSQVINGQLTLQGAAGDRYLTLSTNAGWERQFILNTAGVARWRFGASNVAEGGANAGTDFVFNRYSDAGAFIETALQIKRATGHLGVGIDPLSRLDLSQLARLRVDLSNASLVKYINTNPAANTYVTQRVEALDYAFYSGGNLGLYQDTAGSVGISAVPVAKLDVYTGGGSNIVLSRSGNGYGAFQRSSSSGNNCYDFYSIAGGEVGRITVDGSNNITFGNGPSATDRVRITNSGNLGVGASSIAAVAPIDVTTGAGRIFLSASSVNDNSIMSVNAANNAFRDMRFTGAAFKPDSDGAQNLGEAARRWQTVYASVGTINTSDEEAKRDILPIEDLLLDAWAAVNWTSYRFKDAFEKKGDDARWHFGLIAQRVRDAIDAKLGEGSAVRLGLVCFDEWEDSYRWVMAEVEQVTTGYVPLSSLAESDFEEEEVSIFYTYEAARWMETINTGETEVEMPAGSRWGLRYDECHALEAAYQRRRLSRIEAKLAALETQ